MSDAITISTDASRLDLDVIHGYLARSYWAQGIPRETVERSIAGSLCFGAFDGQRQIGFARVVTDRATFAYLADVFVLEEFRGRGVASRLTTRRSTGRDRRAGPGFGESTFDRTDDPVVRFQTRKRAQYTICRERERGPN